MTRFLSLLFSPHGRVDRATFWQVYVTQGVIVALIAVGAFFIDPDAGDTTPGLLAVEAALVMLYLACAAAGVVLGIKRFHDQGRSGWWTLLSFVPVVGGLLYLIAVGVPRGVASAKSYGSNLPPDHTQRGS